MFELIHIGYINRFRKYVATLGLFVIKNVKEAGLNKFSVFIELMNIL